jgi:hypothetical protein
MGAFLLSTPGCGNSNDKSHIKAKGISATFPNPHRKSSEKQKNETDFWQSISKGITKDSSRLMTTGVF